MVEMASLTVRASSWTASFYPANLEANHVTGSLQSLGRWQTGTSQRGCLPSMIELGSGPYVLS